MHSKFVTTFVISVLSLIVLGHKIDYCDEDMCPYQGQHIRCDNDGSFSDSCPGRYWVENLNPYIDLILHEHNTYRHMLASGNLRCFKPATRMPELFWNDKLAETAAFNVRTCIFAHDKCRSEPEYPYAGQNIYYAKTNRENVTLQEFIIEAIFLWFDEQKDCSHTILESFEKTNPQTGHFCLLVNDRNTEVGCAILIAIIPSSSERGRDKTMVIFTCNYTSTNIRKRPSYKPGLSGNECKIRSKRYSSLCVDRVNPNDIDWYEYE